MNGPVRVVATLFWLPVILLSAYFNNPPPARPWLAAVAAVAGGLAWVVVAVRPGRPRWLDPTAIVVLAASGIAFMAAGGGWSSVLGFCFFAVVAAGTRLPATAAVGVLVGTMVGVALVLRAEHPLGLGLALLGLAGVLLVGMGRRESVRREEQRELQLVNAARVQEEHARAAGLGQPFGRQVLCALDLRDGVGGCAVAQQHEPRSLELDGEGGERVREDVVHVAGDPGAFGQGRRAGVLLLHPGRVHQLQLPLLLAAHALPPSHPEQEDPGQPEQGDRDRGRLGVAVHERHPDSRADEHRHPRRAGQPGARRHHREEAEPQHGRPAACRGHETDTGRGQHDDGGRVQPPRSVRAHRDDDPRHTAQPGGDRRGQRVGGRRIAEIGAEQDDRQPHEAACHPQRTVHRASVARVSARRRAGRIGRPSRATRALNTAYWTARLMPNDAASVASSAGPALVCRNAHATSTRTAIVSTHRPTDSHPPRW